MAAATVIIAAMIAAGAAALAAEAVVAARPWLSANLHLPADLRVCYLQSCHLCGVP